MPELLYKRRTKENDPTLVSAFAFEEEILQYFSCEEEWKTASRLYWGRFYGGIPDRKLLASLGIGVTEAGNFMVKYKKFLLHGYDNKKATD